MKSIIFYIKLFFLTKSLDKYYNKAIKLEEQQKLEEKNKIVNSAMKHWAKNVIEYSGSTIEINGKENIPENESFLIVPNHESMFDVPAIMLSFEKLISFVTKTENNKIPFVSKWLKLSDSISINRSSAREAVKNMNKGIKQMQDGTSLVIFAEGTRTIDGNLGEFKAGSFKFAKKANVKVLPIAIDGTMEIMKKGSMKINSSKIKVNILKPIDSTNFNTKELAEMTKQNIQKSLNLK
ncbi:MAG: hypothetical protein CSB15_01120 [Clostridiales bacterium]|nr:MAG: hypothetical protein CSB15_01120 [Clostridiales bacterium]